MEFSPKLVRQLIVWTVISIAAYGVVLAAMEDSGKLMAAIAAIDGSVWFAVLALSTLSILVRYLRWQYYLASLGHRVAPLRCLQSFLAGFAFTITPAKAGEAVRSLYLKQDGVGYTNSFAALFVERLTDLLAVVLISLAAAYTYESYRWMVWAAGACTMLVLPLIHSSYLRSLLEVLAQRSEGSRFGPLFGRLVNLIDSSSLLLRSGPLYGGMLMSLLSGLLVSYMMYLALVALNATISVPLAMGIYAIGILVGALSFLPGGIGSAEAVMIGLLILGGVDLASATVATLICRIAALWYSIGAGLIMLLWLELSGGPPYRGAN